MRCVSALLIATSMLLAAPAPRPADRRQAQARIDRILKKTPLIDGHNDLPWELRAETWQFSVDGLASGTATRAAKPLMTDMARLRAGPRRRAVLVGLHHAARSLATRRSARPSSRSTSSRRLIAAYPQRSRARLDRRRPGPHPPRRARSARCSGMEGGRQIGSSTGGAAPVPRPRRALHDADPQPDDRMGRRRHRRAQARRPQPVRRQGRRRK